MHKYLITVVIAAKEPPAFELARCISSFACLQYSKKIQILFNSNVKEILDDKVILSLKDGSTEKEIRNDLVYIFAGGGLPTKFLEQIGIGITTKFGDPLLKHSK